MKSSHLTLAEFYSIFKRSFGAYRGQVLALVVLGFVNGILGGFGVSAIIPLFSFVTEHGAVGTDVISRGLHSFFVFAHVDYTLISIVTFILVVFFLKTGFFLLATYLNYRSTQLYQERTRLELFKGTLSANWQYLLSQKLGHVETIMVKNVERAALLFEQTSAALMLFTMMVAYAFVAFNISSKVTIAIFVTASLALVFMRAFPRRVERLSIKLEALYRDVSHHVNESILAMKTIKSRGVEESVLDRTRPVLKDITHESLKIRMSIVIPNSMLEPVSVVLVIGIFAYLRHDPSFNIAALAALVYVIKQIFTYLMQIQGYALSAREYAPYARVVLAYLDSAKENEEAEGGKAAFAFARELQFNHVQFAYENNKDVFTDLSFSVKKGEFVGLIGSSGAGKTTLVDLLLRLFVPRSGSITLDGVTSEQISLNDWRTHIGYVPQEVFLRNGTIAENIRFYDQNITDEAMREAAKLANIFDFIESLPEKWETHVGERGVKLSGGQKQRIGIAMALARKPEIVIFDEATSSLDNESESLIKQAMENMRNKVTIVAIAHRLTTIMDADRIIAIGDGKVLEEGKPKVLLARPDSYLKKISSIGVDA